MLIDYSIRSFEILERELSCSEKEEVFDVFFRMGVRMGLKNLPENYNSYKNTREIYLQQHLYFGTFTKDLFKQYQHHLGFFRYQLLLESQRLLVPKRVRKLLHLRSFSWLVPIISVYKFSRNFQLNDKIKSFILPAAYLKEIKSLDHIPA
ncbi:hypothetical protein [Gramella sp. AN32]|uniref:Maturase K n=1 Tax=Christiangramia antarctica TaxID=2058158 RepID=A0ABW5X2R5_9FLAO|nr:hypothetical protein [Gramella sp. AN32]